LTPVVRFGIIPGVNDYLLGERSEATMASYRVIVTDERHGRQTEENEVLAELGVTVEFKQAASLEDQLLEKIPVSLFCFC
jgi:hypothetical protein